ncbi:MAG TPA: HAMP domain-containing sensor histidine kinase [Actinomycetes bacterium]|nr:HAMP domain-containing sensor histidine kinase [Actinomycetes bacterium]
MAGRHRWSALTVYVLAVAAAGTLLWVVLAVNGGVRAARDAPPVFWLLVGFLVVSQARPMDLPRLGDLKEITVSSTFAWALLLAWGKAPAVLALAAGSVVADVLERKALRKVVFNAAQYTLALGAAGAVFALLGGRPPFTIGQLPAFAVGALVFFVVNWALVETVATIAQGARLSRRVWADIRVEILPEAILAAMAPMVVVLAQESVVLVLLLPLPMTGVYLACKAAIEADANRSAAEAAAAAARVVAAEQARLAQAEQTVARQLQESERLKENLLATVSHELRTPLAGVLGAIATLEQRGHVLSTDVRHELVGIAARQGKRLRELIEELLLAATIEQIPSEHVPLPVDLSELARQACAAAKLAGRTQTVTLSLNDALPVRVAPEAVLQVLTNLLDNAARYSPAGASILLEASRRGNQAVIAVEDAGPGVPRSERERIFGRFTRLNHHTGGAARGGVGLGLYVARQLARAQGGDLEAKEPAGAGGGARFELRLPLAGEVAAVEPVRAREVAPGPS